MSTRTCLLLLVASLAGCSGISSTAPTTPPTQTAQHQAIRSLQPQFNGTSDVVQSAVAHTHSTSTTCTFPSAPTAGNLLVFGVGLYPGANTTTAPAGVTTIDAAANSQMRTYYRVAQSGDGTTWAFTASASSYLTVACYEVAGEDPNAPIDAHGSQNVSNSTTFTTPSVTPVTSGDLPLAFFGDSQSGTFSNLTTGFTADQTQGAGAFDMLAAHGAIAGTGAQQASVTIGAAGYGGTALLLLKPSGATPTPSPPPVGMQYVYPKGSAPNCNVYQPGDWLTADLVDSGGADAYVPTAKDAGSDTLMSYLQTSYGNLAWYLGSKETVNMATNSTATFASAQTETGDLYGDSSNIPWTDGSFITEQASTHCPGPSGSDCHTVELNTDNCVTYENYTTAALSDMISAGKFQGGNGYVHNLNHSYNDQYVHGGLNISFASVPMMGSTAWGEDLNYQQTSCQPNCFIPHILGFFMPINGASESGHTAPALQDQSCAHLCTHEIKAGARLVLNASFTCPGVANNPQANLICNTLKKYGMIYDDQDNNWGCTLKDYGHSGDCLLGLRIGTNKDGSNPWKGNGCCPGAGPPYTNANGTDLDDLLIPNGGHYMHFTDFYVISGGVAL